MTPSSAPATTVGIIGAGVSGLAACKQCCEQGFKATVFEGKPGLGGVWKASYPSTRLQTPKGAYEFSDFPWPDSVSTFPTHHQVVDYLEGYARHFGFMDRIRFNSQIVEVKKKVKAELGKGNLGFPGRVGEEGGDQLTERFLREGQNGEGGGGGDWEDRNASWEICVRKKVPTAEGDVDYVHELFTFDYLIMCCGRFGDVARLPSFPSSQGPNTFNGKVLHALDYSALDSEGIQDLLCGKKVVVVGFQKTSLDIAVEVAELNQGVDEGQSCTLLYRRAHWMFPRHRQAFGLFGFGYFCGTRLSGYFTPKPGQSWFHCLLQSIFTPVRLLIWKLLEYYLQCTIPVSQYGIEPEHSLFEDLSSCVLPQLPQSLLGHLGARRIVPKKISHWDFYPKGVRLADGTDIEADVVILCTGYDGNAKLKSILPEDDRDVLFEPDGILSLYRGIIHPQIPNMGFIGYLEGLSSLHSSEMAAVWLAQLFQKRVALPEVAAMEMDRQMWLSYLKTQTPFLNRTSACVATVQIWQTDKLCKDMGYKSLRKQTWWEEIFSIYGNSDYKFLSSSLPSQKPQKYKDSLTENGVRVTLGN